MVASLTGNVVCLDIVGNGYRRCIYFQGMYVYMYLHLHRHISIYMHIYAFENNNSTVRQMLLNAMTKKANVILFKQESRELDYGGEMACVSSFVTAIETQCAFPLF